MVLIDRARHVEGRVDLVSAKWAVEESSVIVGAQRIERIDVARQRVERALRRIPFRYELGVAARRADLQAGRDVCLGGLVIVGRTRPRPCAGPTGAGHWWQSASPGRRSVPRSDWMVLLTAVPVSVPGSMAMGVMVGDSAPEIRRAAAGRGQGARHGAGGNRRRERARPRPGRDTSLSPNSLLSTAEQGRRAEQRLVDVGATGERQAAANAEGLADARALPGA